jgi:hypothetical protein
MPGLRYSMDPMKHCMLALLARIAHIDPRMAALPGCISGAKYCIPDMHDRIVDMKHFVESTRVSMRSLDRFIVAVLDRMIVFDGFISRVHAAGPV